MVTSKKRSMEMNTESWIDEWKGSSISFKTETRTYKKYELSSIPQEGIGILRFSFYVDKRKCRTQGAIFIYNVPGTPCSKLAQGEMAEFLEKMISSLDISDQKR